MIGRLSRNKKRQKETRKVRKSLTETRYELLLQVYGLLNADVGEYIKDCGYDYLVEYTTENIVLYFITKDDGKKVCCLYSTNELLYLILNYKTEKKDMIKKIEKFIEIEEGKDGKN